ncbi:CPBP family intramembrane glutamic endopeptidase [Clostridium oryzae]|uniref:CAAX amino terminal protease self-immunity n=1 Tax=Clostridium oryzae TaxID=1450648 RepID=A0A1V4IWD4_9CLOT|nr:CPBP family intramembrane glutamic endopeptidase [Clostridium oryzae]OPJ64362.1 CAAX amino terminal protease self- immunity [Clostridium oryzae]
MGNNSKSKIFRFLLLTFAISWLCWGSIIVANQFELLPYGTPLTMIIFGIGGNGAPIASYILLRKWGEIDGFKDFLKRNFGFKASTWHYGLILILLAIHFVIPILLMSTNRKMPIYFGVLLIPILIFGGGLEEIGWRGILQPHLETFNSFITSTIIVAAIWSIWHLPLWFIRGAAQSGKNYLMFCVLVLGLSFTLAVIRRCTNNVFLCILFHSCIDSFSTVFKLQQGLSTIITTILEVVLALFIIQTKWCQPRDK